MLQLRRSNIGTHKWEQAPTKTLWALKSEIRLTFCYFFFRHYFSWRSKGKTRQFTTTCPWMAAKCLYFVHASLRPIFLPIGGLWTLCGNFRIFLPLRFYVKTEVRDFGASKIAIFLSILKLMNFDFSKMFPLFKAEIY